MKQAEAVKYTWQCMKSNRSCLVTWYDVGITSKVYNEAWDQKKLYITKDLLVSMLWQKSISGQWTDERISDPPLYSVTISVSSITKAVNEAT